MAEALEVTIDTGIAGTSVTELGTRVEVAEALEVTIDTLIAGTSDTEPSTRAELAGFNNGGKGQGGNIIGWLAFVTRKTEDSAGQVLIHRRRRRRRRRCCCWWSIH